VARRLVGRGGIQGTRLAAAPVAAADGAPLPDELRTVLEPRFGADFGGVRLHTGAHADRLSTALHARAVTTGRDVFFRHGTYAPGSQAGQWLLAHELAHVVQLVNVGDLIMDLGPWSSSGIRRSHEGVDFGSQGTLQEPRVHFIINGLTGVFLPRYTNTETEVREVLFQARTIFRVTKITNYFDLTFFVWVDEVDPSTLGTHPRTKNPYSGAVNR